MAQRRFFRRLFGFALAVVVIAPLLLGALAKLGPQGVLHPLSPPAHRPEAPSPDNAAAQDGAPVITAARQIHILHGDRTGGGHLHGTGRPCKTEFPQGWNAEKIIHTVRRAAANDNIPWKEQENGYHTADIMAEGVRIRIVLSADRRDVITAYPVNLPRNPCPANDDRRY